VHYACVCITCVLSSLFPLLRSRFYRMAEMMLQRTINSDALVDSETVGLLLHTMREQGKFQEAFEKLTEYAATIGVDVAQPGPLLTSGAGSEVKPRENPEDGPDENSVRPRKVFFFLFVVVVGCCIFVLFCFGVVVLLCFGDPTRSVAWKGLLRGARDVLTPHVSLLHSRLRRLVQCNRSTCFTRK